jgi:DNA-binding transcriptional ArsR family regulator
MPNAIPSKTPIQMTSIAMTLQHMKASAEQACKLMKVLSNPDRLMILCQLANAELCVSEIEKLLSIGQPTLSQQLTVLREEGLVTTRRDGKNIYYQISSTSVLAVIQTLYEQFCQPDASVQHAD